MIYKMLLAVNDIDHAAAAADAAVD